jgi:hypothetical protein
VSVRVDVSKEQIVCFQGVERTGELHGVPIE